MIMGCCGVVAGFLLCNQRVVNLNLILVTAVILGKLSTPIVCDEGNEIYIYIYIHIPVYIWHTFSFGYEFRNVGYQFNLFCLDRWLFICTLTSSWDRRCAADFEAIIVSSRYSSVKHSIRFIRLLTRFESEVGENSYITTSQSTSTQRSPNH